MAFVKWYESSVEFTVPGVSDNVGAEYLCHIRDISNNKLLATLSTANGRITIHAGDVMRLTLPGSVTATLEPEFIYDVVRTDINPDQFMGFGVKDKLHVPATRPAI